MSLRTGKPKLPTLSEKQIERLILDWLNYQTGVFAFKVQTTGVWDPTQQCFRSITNRHQHKGTADIVGLKKGKFFALEVKTPQALKTALRTPSLRDLNQSRFIDRVIDKGGRASRVCSLEEAIRFIDSV